MADQVILYISAATDLESERDLLARAVTEIPVDLPWRIEQSPRRNLPLDTTALTNADIHILLLAGDIRAPVGLEWMTASRLGHQPLLYLKQAVQRTPAAMNFIRFVESKSTWLPFKDGAELRQKVLMRLADYILERATGYHLSLVELERLRSWRAELEVVPLKRDQEKGGAGESSLLLSLERHIPSEGVLLRPDRGQNDEEQA